MDNNNPFNKDLLCLVGAIICMALAVIGLIVSVFNVLIFPFIATQ